jgi:AcrR family transcriptional regulator
MFSDPPETSDAPRSNVKARDRVLQTAYALFCRYGVQAVGVDRIIAQAGVAKMTLYKHFRSKEDLVVSALDLREERWTHGWLEVGIDQRGGTPQARLLAVFDLLDAWFRRDDYEGCLFNNSLLEIHDPSSPIRVAAKEKRANVRTILCGLAEEAGAPDPTAFAHEWQLLMTGAMVAADAGDRQAAQRARRIGSLVLEREGLLP